MVNVVRVKTLTPDEVIGNPERNDFPLLKVRSYGQANFRGSPEAAFTDMPGTFEGTLRMSLNYH